MDRAGPGVRLPLLTSGLVMSVYFLKLALAIVALDMLLLPTGRVRRDAIADDRLGCSMYSPVNSGVSGSFFKDMYLS